MNTRTLRRRIRGVRGTSRRRDPKRLVGHNGRRDDIAIAQCRRCPRYGVVWLPAKVCERCLLAAAKAAGMLDEKDEDAA